MWFRNLLCRRADIHWKSQELPKWGIFGNRQPGPAGLTISLAGGQAGVSTTGSRVNSDSHFVAFAVQSLSCVRLFATPWTARPPCPSPTPGVYPNSCPLSQRCHPTISSSVVPFSSQLQSFPASGSFQMSQLFTSGGQGMGASSSASVLPMNIQD